MSNYHIVLWENTWLKRKGQKKFTAKQHSHDTFQAWEHHTHPAALQCSPPADILQMREQACLRGVPGSMDGSKEISHNIYNNTGRPNTRINDPAPNSTASPHMSTPWMILEHILKNSVLMPYKDRDWIAPRHKHQCVQGTQRWPKAMRNGFSFHCINILSELHSSLPGAAWHSWLSYS